MQATQARSHWILLIFLLLVGAALRIHGLAPMDKLLHHDEAYNGVDAIALLENPRLTPYFPNNTGREGLYYYLLAPFVGSLGARPLALRLTSMFIGVLTLAAVYPLGKAIIGTHGALWAVGALAVVYWPIHLNHLVFRVNTFPLLGALAMTALLRAQRLNQRWWLAGLFVGLLLYTYVAAQVWFAYALLWLLLWLVFDEQRRRGALLALILALLVSLPLLLALWTPAETTAPITRAAAEDWPAVQQNLDNWLNAWLSAGDANPNHNLPGRPILDVPLAILSVLGMVAAPFIVRRRWWIIWWLGLTLVSFLPTLLSIQTPHFLRGAGLLIPLALLIGTGGALLMRWRQGWLLALGLILWAGVHSYNDFKIWLEEGQLQIYIDDRVNEAMAFIREDTPPQMPLYIPGLMYHPVAAFHAANMPQRDTIFYQWPDGACFVTPREEAIFLDFPILLNSFERRVQPYAAEVAPLLLHPDAHYNIYRVQPHHDLIAAWTDSATIADLLEVRVVEPTKTNISAGDTLQVYLAMRIMNPPQSDYRFFVHLQGNPTPYTGGPLWSTGDAPLCRAAYDSERTLNETVVQTLHLPIPIDIAPGEYHIALGLYNPLTNQRLPLQTPTDENRYYEALRFTVTP